MGQPLQPPQPPDKQHSIWHNYCNPPQPPHNYHVCYLQEPLTHHFQPLISLLLLGWFVTNLYIWCPPYYIISHTKFEENKFSSSDICSENCLVFFTLFFFAYTVLKYNFEPTLQIWYTYIRLLVAYLRLNFWEI